MSPNNFPVKKQQDQNRIQWCHDKTTPTEEVRRTHTDNNTMTLLSLGVSKTKALSSIRRARKERLQLDKDDNFADSTQNNGEAEGTAAPSVTTSIRLISYILQDEEVQNNLRHDVNTFVGEGTRILRALKELILDWREWQSLEVSCLLPISQKNSSRSRSQRRRKKQQTNMLDQAKSNDDNDKVTDDENEDEVVDTVQKLFRLVADYEIFTNIVLKGISPPPIISVLPLHCRLQSLTLHHLTLTQSQVQCLVDEVLIQKSTSSSPSSSFHSLEINMCQFVNSKVTWMILVYGIQQSTSLRKLSLTNNRLGDAALAKLFQSLAANLFSTSTSSGSSPSVSTSRPSDADYRHKQTFSHLDLTGSSIRANGLQALAQFLYQQARILRTLSSTSCPTSTTRRDKDESSSESQSSYRFLSHLWLSGNFLKSLDPFWEAWDIMSDEERLIEEEKLRQRRDQEQDTPDSLRGEGKQSFFTNMACPLEFLCLSENYLESRELQTLISYRIPTIFANVQELRLEDNQFTTFSYSDNLLNNNNTSYPCLSKLQRLSVAENGLTTEAADHLLTTLFCSQVSTISIATTTTTTEMTSSSPSKMSHSRPSNASLVYPHLEEVNLFHNHSFHSVVLPMLLTNLNGREKESWKISKQHHHRRYDNRDAVPPVKKLCLMKHIPSHEKVWFYKLIQLLPNVLDMGIPTSWLAQGSTTGGRMAADDDDDDDDDGVFFGRRQRQQQSTAMSSSSSSPSSYLQRQIEHILDGRNFWNYYHRVTMATSTRATNHRSQQQQQQQQLLPNQGYIKNGTINMTTDIYAHDEEASSTTTNDEQPGEVGRIPRYLWPFILSIPFRSKLLFPMEEGAKLKLDKERHANWIFHIVLENCLDQILY